MDKNITCDAYSFQHSYENSKNLSFHLFPRDPKTREQWVEAISSFRKGYKPSRTSVLCSEHFVESDYTFRARRMVLRTSAVPTVFDFTCVKKQKAINNQQIELREDNKLDKFSYKSYKESKNAAAQLNLKLKPELLALLQKRNKPILLRRKAKETGSKKQIPESIWIMPSGSVSTSPKVMIPVNKSTSSNPFERFKPKPSIKIVVPKVYPGATHTNKYKTYSNKNKQKSTQLSLEEFVKEEEVLEDEDKIVIKELIKQEHQYCIKVERPEIKQEPLEIKQEIPEAKEKKIVFIKCKNQNELISQNKTILRVKKESDLVENVPNETREIKQEPEETNVYELNLINKEPELIVPELTAELMEQGEEETEYFEFVDVDMSDDFDYDDPLRTREELILS